MLSSAPAHETGLVPPKDAGHSEWASRRWLRLGHALAARGRLGLVGLSLLVVGCPVSSNPQQSTTFANGGSKRAELGCPRESSERVDVGSWRGTGRPDVARVFVRSNSATVLSCREVDLNGDGRKDLLVFYLPDGRKLREEFDHDYDGVADVKSYYEGGVLVRQELDVNYDGKPDLLQHYEGGRLARTEKLWEASESAAQGGKASPAPESTRDASADLRTEGSTAPPNQAPLDRSTGSAPSEPPQTGGTAPLLPSETTPRGITPALPPVPAMPEAAPSPTR